MSLKPLPTGAFRAADEMTWDAKTAIVDAWNLPTRALGELDLNRNGAIIPSPADHAAFKGRQDVLERFHVGFQWQDDDEGTTHWIPQGLTGDSDSTDTEDGRNRLAASWHNEDDTVEKGMRISFVDVTAWSNPIRYRNVLLVNPLGAAQNPSNHVSFAAIAAHAGRRGVVPRLSLCRRLARLRRWPSRRRARVRHETSESGRRFARRRDRLVAERRQVLRVRLSLRAATGRALCAGRRRGRSDALVVPGLGPHGLEAQPHDG